MKFYFIFKFSVFPFDEENHQKCVYREKKFYCEWALIFRQVSGSLHVLKAGDAYTAKACLFIECIVKFQYITIDFDVESYLPIYNDVKKETQTNK